MIMGRKVPRLTIGMAHYDDYDGAYFTIQNIRKELVFSGNAEVLDFIEFVVVDNNPESNHGKVLERFLKNNLPTTNDIRLVKCNENVGTSYTRNRVIEVASGDFVLVMDCHVMLCPVVKVIKRLFELMMDRPNTNDLYTGPLVSDDMKGISTHFNLDWSSGMWGKWGSCFKCECGEYFTGVPVNKCITYRSLVKQETIDSCTKCHKKYPTLSSFGWKKSLVKHGYSNVGWSDSEEFEIPSQGLGIFFVRRESWLGFNHYCRGFGGEEGYIHEKYRQAGRKCINLSWLKWLHRFNRPNGVKYPLTNINKFRNYMLEFNELGLDTKPVIEHFKSVGVDQELIASFIKEANLIYR